MGYPCSCIILLSFEPSKGLHNLLFVVFPQFTYSESRKWCQHTTQRVFKHKGGFVIHLIPDTSGENISGLLSCQFLRLQLFDYSNIILLVNQLNCSHTND